MNGDAGQLFVIYVLLGFCGGLGHGRQGFKGLNLRRKDLEVHKLKLKKYKGYMGFDC